MICFHLKYFFFPQRSKVQQDQGFTTGFLQTIKEPQHTVSDDIYSIPHAPLRTIEAQYNLLVTKFTASKATIEH